LRSDWTKDRVAIISGGGAGHEPAHAGFVGRGMLTAAVSGEIFASPSVDAVLAAIRAVTGPAGCLLVVKNYTGDRLNFGLAAERARAEGFKVATVIVADDIAIPDAPQPRGVAGTLFVHKIAGHAAESGHGLDDVTGAATAAASNIWSLGTSLSTCRIPGQPTEERLGQNEAEIGLGIHGEPGFARVELGPVGELVARMTDQLSAALPTDSGPYAALINNLGAVPVIEMAVIADEILRSRLGQQIELVVGPAAAMTSLDMNGFSLSLMALDEARRTALCSLAAPAAWPPAQRTDTPKLLPLPASERETASQAHAAASEAPATRCLIEAICNSLIDNEDRLNVLDAKIGDGDTGSTMAIGARSILGALDTLPLADTGELLIETGAILGRDMGGSSGVLLSIFLTAAGEAASNGETVPAALKAGLDRMQFYGGAKVGDRSMVDALAPALAALATGGLDEAAAAAAVGADGTAAIRVAGVGRASYVNEADLAGVQDPGAAAIAIVLAAARDAHRPN